MPKRVIDGESLWRSDKLASVDPAWIRAEFANLVPLALANGSFECTPRLVWSRVYCFNRPEITLAQVEQVLNELERVKLLFRWDDGIKTWGYWIGIEKPGRLPGRSRRGTNEAVGPQPPVEQLRKFMESNGIQNLPDGNEKLLGFGFGSGLGIGVGTDSTIPGQHENSKGLGATDVAQIMCRENGWAGWRLVEALREAVEFQASQMPESSLEQVAEWLVAAWKAHEHQAGKFAGSVEKFFNEAKYKTQAPEKPSPDYVPASVRERRERESKTQVACAGGVQ